MSINDGKGWKKKGITVLFCLEPISKICVRDFSSIFLPGKALFAAHTRRVWARKATKHGGQRRRKSATDIFETGSNNLEEVWNFFEVYLHQHLYGERAHQHIRQVPAMPQWVLQLPPLTVGVQLFPLVGAPPMTFVISGVRRFEFVLLLRFNFLICFFILFGFSPDNVRPGSNQNSIGS